MHLEEKRLFWCGLPLTLKDDNLVFGKETKEIKPSIRYFEDLKSVLIEAPNDSKSAAYFMYRDVCLEKDRKKIEENNLRYDITIIPASVIGKEFVKTFGHSHPMVDASKLAFPEVYEVISGMGHFILQGKNECFVVEARAGDHVLIGPNLGHVTINPFNETLVLANWVERNFVSDYSEIKEKHGAAFYETTNGWIKNAYYLENFSLRFFKSKSVPELGLNNGKPMYELVEHIEKLEFLKNPKKFERVFEEYFKS